MKDIPRSALREQRTFVQRMQNSDGFWRAMRALSIEGSVAADDVQSTIEELCRACWMEADSIFSSDGPLEKTRAEVVELKSKLTQCNLSAMKQMSASRSGYPNDGDLGDDTITFHEPLRYLDDSTRNLVLEIVADKVRLLEEGHAPPSLIGALVKHAADASADVPNAADAEELRELREEVEKLRRDSRFARVQIAEAEERASRMEAKLVDVKAKLAKAEEEVAQLREANAELLRENKVLLERTAQQEAVINRQKSVIEEQVARIDRLSQELAEEREANARIRRENEQLKGEIAELKQQITNLQNQLAELQHQFDVLTQEAEAMRQELARRNNVRTVSTQTATTGTKMDKKDEDYKRMKLMVEEMQMKMKELMARCRKRFGSEVGQVVNELGLNDFLKEETVFQRLYDDALERVERLEKLRERVRCERRNLRPDGSPEPPESDVLTAVESSKNDLLHLLEPPGARPTSHHESHERSPIPSRRPSKEGMRNRTTSLPVLPSASPPPFPNMSTVLMDLRGGSMRKKSRAFGGPHGASLSHMPTASVF